MSPLAAVGLFVLGWGPIFVADFISVRRRLNADRDDLEGFALAWLFFTWLFTILGVGQLIVLAVAWAVRFYREWF
jgi:hypothetical protein